MHRKPSRDATPQVSELAFWSAFKKSRRLNPQGLSQPCHDLYGGIADAALDAADVSAVEFSAEGKLFLREALALPFFPQIFPDNPPDIHARGKGWRCL